MKGLSSEFFPSFFQVLGIASRASGVLSKFSTTEQQTQPFKTLFVGWRDSLVEKGVYLQSLMARV